jgi:Leucine-rich repeat (LRR) protein
MKALETLNVENNRLENLPPEIGQLNKLVVLDISNNRLSSLPAELANLTQLRTLKLSGYKGAPSDIEQLKAKLPNTDIQT